MIFGISFTIKTILKICVSGADLIQKSYIFSLTPTKPKDVKEATQTGKIQKKKGPIISRWQPDVPLLWERNSLVTMLCWWLYDGNSVTSCVHLCSVSVASTSGPSGTRSIRGYGWSTGVQPTSLSDRQRCWPDTALNPMLRNKPKNWNLGGS